MAADSPTTGSGFGGMWTPTDDFLNGHRQTPWVSSAKRAKQEGVSKAAPQLPPRVFVDNRTLLREVTDVSELRRGDHLVSSLNVIRCLSPMVDRFWSLLGSIEFTYLYHHLIVMDDVASIDEHGVPRNRCGQPVDIIEYSNTLPESLAEIQHLAGSSLLRFPRAVLDFTFNKAKCQRCPLAAYGDSPHLCLVVEDLDEAARDHVCKKAMNMVKDHGTYHVLFNNCEHNTNMIYKGRHRSPNLHFIIWTGLRTIMCILGLIFLAVFAVSCSSRVPATPPSWASTAFYVLAVLPAAVQAVVGFCQVVESVCRHRRRGLIDNHDYCHLVTKEFARMLVGGGGAVVLMAQMPRLVLFAEDHLAVACAVCLLAPMMLDLFFNFCAHMVMRLVILPVFGRFWLLGEPLSPISPMDAAAAKKQS
eukprot:TRINITY_DN28305_c0_g1_i1.p1 TRINITY_DN28305_c0_g1~~TRINITY_DN28305_c0_g1_i1.p1  ORF type:complete len:417 (+),score=76.67 TRINITY_DN28305_c0_g1_i1:217-1467(+)